MINAETIISTIGAIAPIVNTVVNSLTGNNNSRNNTPQQIDQFEERYEEDGSVVVRPFDGDLFSVDENRRKNNITINFNIYLNIPKPEIGDGNNK